MNRFAAASAAIILAALFSFLPPAFAAGPVSSPGPDAYEGVNVGLTDSQAEQGRKAVEAAQTARRLLDLQVSFPELKPAPQRRASSKGDFTFAPTLAQTLLYLAIAAAVIVIVMVLISAFRGYKPKGPDALPETAEAEAPGTAVLRMDHARLSADALARAGDFAEAMHILLLQSVSELRRRLGVSIADALTSREILERLKMSRLAKGAFGDIIGRVELTHFGGRLPSAEDYLACRQSFDALRDALGGGGAA